MANPQYNKMMKQVQEMQAKMAQALADILGIDKEHVNIKATTNEGVGSIGKGDAIAAFAVVTLEEKR